MRILRCAILFVLYFDIVSQLREFIQEQIFAVHEFPIDPFYSKCVYSYFMILSPNCRGHLAQDRYLVVEKDIAFIDIDLFMVIAER